MAARFSYDSRNQGAVGASYCNLPTSSGLFGHSCVVSLLVIRTLPLHHPVCFSNGLISICAAFGWADEFLLWATHINAHIKVNDHLICHPPALRTAAGVGTCRANVRYPCMWFAIGSRGCRLSLSLCIPPSRRRMHKLGDAVDTHRLVDRAQ